MAINTLTLDYDRLDRLTSAEGAWGSGSLSYDALGNITKKALGTENIKYHYHLGQQLVARYNDAPQQADGLGYTGHLEDDDLELTYMQARYYDPVIGRFYSNDPKDASSFISQGKTQGFNRYAYAANNPYRYTDPNGKDYSSVFISADIPFYGGIDIGVVQFSKDVLTGRGETDIGLFVTGSKPVEDGLGMVDTTGIGGATIGLGIGSNTRSTFDGTNASIKVGTGVATVGAGGLLGSSQDKSITVEFGPSIGVEGYQEQTFSITAGDVIDTVNGWFSGTPKEELQD